MRARWTAGADDGLQIAFCISDCVALLPLCVRCPVSRCLLASVVALCPLHVLPALPHLHLQYSSFFLLRFGSPFVSLFRARFSPLDRFVFVYSKTVSPA